MPDTKETPVTALEYDRLESTIEAALQRRETEFRVAEIAAAVDVPEWKAREVLAYFARRYAYFNHTRGDVFRAQLPEGSDTEALP